VEGGSEIKTTLGKEKAKEGKTKKADKNLREVKGDWKVEIKGMDGNLLKEIKFKVE
jgi:hypothetical protein